MALFSKSTALTALVKRLQSECPSRTEELTELVQQIVTHADFAAKDQIWMLSHPQTKVRIAFCETVASTPAAGIEASLLKEVLGKSSDVRLDAVKLCWRIAPNFAATQIPSLLQAQKPEARELGLDFISASPQWQKYLGHLKAMLRDPADKLRQRAVRLLGRDVADATIFMILRNLINDEDAVVRHLVIESLAQSQNPEIIAPFFERLGHEEHEHRSIMTRALTKLARNAPARVEEHLLPILADEDPALRDTAVSLLKEMPDQEHVLRAFLMHSSGLAFWLRERAMQSIQKISSDLVAPLTSLLGDADEDVRIGALGMLKSCTDPRIVVPVRAIFESNADWWVRSMAAEILGEVPGDELTRLLISRLSDAELCYSIIHVLGRRAGSEARSAVFRCLCDESRSMRCLALSALRGAKSPEVVEAVAQLAEHDPEAIVRNHALETLKELGTIAAAQLRRISGHDVETAPFSVDVPQDLQMANEALNASEPVSS
ncbi:MAG: HEAT repeat domain-containing protein [Planctomycetota bacterium]